MSETTRTYKRFSLPQRLSHLFYLLSFITLATTGLPQKYPSNGFSVFVIRTLGGIETVRTIHHTAAVILILVSLFHLLHLGEGLYVKHVRPTILPTLQDAKDALQAFLYNLGFARQRPQMGHFTFEEKAEYWALVWGTVIMILTGFIMWNPIFVTRFVDGQIVAAAKAAHGAEAVLAVLAIIVWHFYGVFIKRLNKSMFTGKISEDEMLDEHPLELADIKAGMAERPVDPVKLKKRQQIFYPVAVVVGLVMLYGVYAFVTMEQTALPVPPNPMANVVAYSPQTPTPLPVLTPTPTPTATSAPAASSSQGTPAPTSGVVLTYKAFAGPLFQQKCGACHGTNGQGGLTLTTFGGAMQGGVNGRVILPGDPYGSLLVQIQTTGGHPGQLSPDELSQIIKWIANGVPEQ